MALRTRKTSRTNPGAKALNDAIRGVLADNPLAYVSNGVTAPQFGSGNGKTGFSFTLPEGYTCPNQTAACAATCYLQFGSFTFPAARNSRNRNYALVIALLKIGEHELAKALIKGIGNAPTCRVHDGGDYFSPAYVRAWIMACKACPNTKFWAYTRSWATPAIEAELRKLASLENFKLWISIDRDNWLTGVALYRANRDVYAGLAFMELDGDEELAAMISAEFPRANVVIFPAHSNGGKHIAHNAELPNCPAIIKAIPEDNKNPACLVCRKCL